MIPIHVDDILVFKEISEQMRIVAKNYELPLRSITGLPMPKSGLFDRMGDCDGSGNVRLVLRCVENGIWCDEPLSPKEVIATAAHELAHLRHLNHGAAFLDFCEELQVAMENQQVDHRQKILDKLIKLQASRQSEAELGNSEAAESFAAMINSMLITYELEPSDIDFARATDRDPVIEIQAQLNTYGVKPSKVRIAWQESLASGIANAHLCRILIRPGSNAIYFVGTKSHATVAEYVYGTLVPAVAKMSGQAEVKYWRETGCGRGQDNKAKGYRAAWIDSFIIRIWQRFAEARRDAVEAAAAAKGTSTETGLMRLDGALVKVRKYIDDRFSNRKVARAGALNHRSRNHDEGRAAGTAAANAITLGQRGMSPVKDRKQIN